MKKRVQKALAKPLYKSAFSRALFTLYGIVWKELKLAIHQFFTWKHPVYSLYKVTVIYCSSLTRIALGRSLKYSFAYTGEDRLIESILKPKITENGFYVEVGCNHPKFLSNTYSLYRKGWKGICIDANPTLIKKYSYMRPLDKAVCSLVSNEETAKTFYIAENNVLSTVEKENLMGEDMQGIAIQATTLNSQKLTSILDNLQAPVDFDFLSIDAEEHDFEVLSSLDLFKYTPRLIIVEDETFEPTQPELNKFTKHLAPFNYCLEGYVLKNLYFIKKMA